MQKLKSKTQAKEYLINRMSGKSWGIGIVLIAIIGISLAYFLTDGFISLPKLDGSTQIKVGVYGSNIGVTNQQVGDYKYFFAYTPNATNYLGQHREGNLVIWRQDIQGSTQFDLTTNISQDYNGLTFTITEVKPSYIIVTVKTTS
jgi:hypothetical protein